MSHVRSHRSGQHRRPGLLTGDVTNGRKAAASLVLLVVVGLVGSLGSWAAWVVGDTNSGNTFSTSTVLLQDNQGGQAGSAATSGTALFNVTNMSPGSAATTKCIGVVFSGAAASSMTLSATLGGAGQAVLEDELTMDVAQYNTGPVSVTSGVNTNSGSCAGYPVGGGDTLVGAQGATLQAWAAGGPYTIAGPVTNTWYQFTVSGLPAGDTDCSTYCNKTITIALTWTLTTT